MQCDGNNCHTRIFSVELHFSSNICASLPTGIPMKSPSLLHLLYSLFGCNKTHTHRIKCEVTDQKQQLVVPTPLATFGRCALNSALRKVHFPLSPFGHAKKVITQRSAKVLTEIFSDYLGLSVLRTFVCLPTRTLRPLKHDRLKSVACTHRLSWRVLYSTPTSEAQRTAKKEK